MPHLLGLLHPNLPDPGVLGLNASGLNALHMGALHPFEQALTVLLAFGPFVLLGFVVWWRGRADAREEAGLSGGSDDSGASDAGEVVPTDPDLDVEGLDQQVADERLELPADQRDADPDVERDRLGRRPT